MHQKSAQDAFYATVHDHRHGGVPALAARMGMTPAMLYNKANPNNTTHRPYLHEIEAVMAFTGDARVLESLSAGMSRVSVPLPPPDVSDANLLESYTALMARLGDFSQKFHGSLADGDITQDELEDMRQTMMSCISAGLGLIGRIEEISN